MARAYHDRKMLKWLPFEALEPQREALRRVFTEESEPSMPELSEDQARANQYRLEEALNTKDVVRIRYFEDGARRTLYTRITRLDPLRRLIGTEAGGLDPDKIIEIE